MACRVAEESENLFVRVAGNVCRAKGDSALKNTKLAKTRRYGLAQLLKVLSADKARTLVRNGDSFKKETEL